jgi:hypothetical protein
LLLARVTVAVALAGCSGVDDVVVDAAAVIDGDLTDAPIDARSCPVGDPAQPLEVVPIASDLSDEIEITDGAVVGLIRPDQGGKVIFVGVKARNFDPCQRQLYLTGALIAPATGQVIALEQRPVRLDPGADGWGHPYTLYYDLANVPACPNAATTVDIDRSTWRLELRLDEGETRSVTVTRSVMPRCLRPEQQADCECECDSDFVLGEACPVDP